MNKKKKEFSKTLLIQESVLVWTTTLICLFLGGYCIYRGFTGALPWISSIIVSAYAAYGVSQMMYYKKSQAENTAGGIKYEAVLEEVKKVKDYYNGNSTTYPGFDYDSSTTTYTTTTTYKATENIDDYQI